MKQSDRLERILHRRSDRLMQLISMQFGTGRGALKTFADRLGYKESQLSRWTNRKQFLREDSARYIEEQLSLKELWMDMPNEPIEQSSALIASEPMPPLYTQMRAQEPEKTPSLRPQSAPCAPSPLMLGAWCSTSRYFSASKQTTKNERIT